MEERLEFGRLRVKLEHLQLVALLDETWSLSRAAERLHLTPAALSKRLAAVEETLGVRLFERTPTGMHKTAFGAALAHRARVILDELRHAEGEITDLLEDRRQRISVGAFFVAMPVLLPRAIAHLTRSSPRCLVAVQEGDMHELIGGLRKGDFDLIVGRILPEQMTVDIATSPLYDEKLLAVARPAHPLSKEGDLTWARVADFPWVLPPKHSPVRAQLQSMFHSSGTAGPQVIVEALSVPTTLGLIESSDAIGLLPETLAFAEQNRHRLVVLRFELPALPAPMSTAWLAARPLPPLASALVAALDETAAQLRSQMPMSPA